MSRKNSRKRRKSEQVKRRQIRSFCVMGIVASAMLLVIGYSAVSSYEKNQDYKEQELLLMAELEEEMQRTVEIEEYKVYTQTDEFVEDMAKEKLNMAYSEDVIFVPTE